MIVGASGCEGLVGIKMVSFVEGCCEGTRVGLFNGCDEGCIEGCTVSGKTRRHPGRVVSGNPSRGT